MSIGQQTNQETIDQIFLADDDLIDFVEQRLHKGAGLLDFRVDGAYSGIHLSCDINADRQLETQIRSEKKPRKGMQAEYRKQLRRSFQPLN